MVIDTWVMNKETKEAWRLDQDNTRPIYLDSEGNTVLDLKNISKYQFYPYCPTEIPKFEEEEPGEQFTIFDYIEKPREYPLGYKDENGEDYTKDILGEPIRFTDLKTYEGKKIVQELRYQIGSGWNYYYRVLKVLEYKKDVATSYSMIDNNYVVNGNYSVVRVTDKEGKEPHMQLCELYNKYSKYNGDEVIYSLKEG